MAVIQTIRNRAGLLVAIIIGMALVAFILGDMLSSGGQVMNKAKANVAVVNGKNVSIDKFQALISEQEELIKMQSNRTSLDEETQLQVRQRAWDEMIQTLVMDREFDKLGLGVSGDELYDMVNGDNPHPFIMQFFADPTTGVINRIALAQFLQSVNNLEDGNSQKLFWFYLEDQIYKERKVSKYNTLLRQGLYATKLEAKRRNAEMNTSADFSYVVKSYSAVPDSTISISDAEIKAYYKEHINEYKQERSADIRYVVWEVVPSAKDVKTAEKWINEVKPELEEVDADRSLSYVRANSDIQPEERNYAKGELDTDLDSFAFAANEGDVYGPYFEDNHYKLAKLAKVLYLPDSVKASHILFQVDQSNAASVSLLADSLKTLIENGANFAALAAQYSSDQSNANDGGNLNWFTEGKMVKPFSDSCFYGKTGDVKLVYSQFGIHIVKITAQSRPAKKVQVAILAREVRASDETDQSYFTQASDFGAINNTREKFEQAIADGKVVALSAQNIDPNANEISGLENSRQLVRWAFNHDVGSVTKRVMEFDNKYVVALLTASHEEGFADIEEVKTAIEVELRKQKQGEQLLAEVNSKLEDVSVISAVASNLGLTTKLATNVRFTSYSIPNLGTEPKLQAAAITLDQGQVSPAIEGTNGVYVIQVDNVNVPEETTDYSLAKSFITRSYASRVNYNSQTVLNELANIEDNRITFF